MLNVLRTAGAIMAAAFLYFIVPAAHVQAHPSIDIVASNWKFTPNTITVQAGEQTTLRLTSSEGVHGLASSDLGIAQTTIMPGKTVTVTFTPKKAGTYKLNCTIMCGAGHANMVLTIIVKAS